MQGVFFALGPGLPAGKEIGAVQAVDVYPVLVRLLGLRAAGGLDGSPAGLADRLVPAGGPDPARAAP